MLDKPVLLIWKATPMWEGEALLRKWDRGMGSEVLQLGPAAEGPTSSSLPSLLHHAGLHPTEAEAEGHTSSPRLQYCRTHLPQEREK